MDTTITSGADATPRDLLGDLPDVNVKTVTRLIGRLLVYPEDRNATLDSVQRVDLGIGVASEEAFLAGVVPDPDFSSEYPARGWLWVTTAVMVHNNASGTVEDWFYPEILFDVGANRVVDKGRLFLAISNNLSDGSARSVRVTGRIRSLILL